MQTYEIRIFWSQGRGFLSCQEMHLTDSSAIDAGQRMSGGKAFEVWRDLDCIHRSPAHERKTDAANENSEARKGA
jgi:hypothetical protein